MTEINPRVRNYALCLCHCSTAHRLRTLPRPEKLDGRRRRQQASLGARPAFRPGLRPPSCYQHLSFLASPLNSPHEQEVAREPAQPPYQQPLYTINKHPILPHPPSPGAAPCYTCLQARGASKRIGSRLIAAAGATMLQHDASSNVAPAAAIRVWERQRRKMMPPAEKEHDA